MSRTARRARRAAGGVDADGVRTPVPLLVAPPVLRIEEDYRLEQVISESRMPAVLTRAAGAVRAALVCDGQAYRDWHDAPDPAPRGAVGHLAFAGYHDTDLASSCPRGRLPLTVPVVGREAAAAGSREVVWSLDYRPSGASAGGAEAPPAPTAGEPPTRPTMLRIAALDVAIDDADTADLDRSRLGPRLSAGEPEPGLLDDIAQKMMDHARFRPSLVVSIAVVVEVEVPRGRTWSRTTLRSLGVALPQPVSLDPSSLRLRLPEPSSGTGRSRAAAPRLHHDPETGAVRWYDVPLAGREKGGDPEATTTTWRFVSPTMYLTIGQPGELFDHDDLAVTAVVELDGLLLSGTRTKVFDSRGRPRPGSLTERSVLHVDCSVSLTDAFASRVLSPYQSLVFDEIVPDPRRATDVASVLGSLGYEVVRHTIDSSEHPLLSLMRATRGTGPTRSELWVLVRGRRAATHRRTRQGDEHQYSSRLESGDLTLFVRGWARGSAAGLVSHINDLHVALKERFRPLRSRR